MLPINLEVKDEKRLEIHWDDGHIGVYELTYLRENCPCANCEESRKHPEKTTRSGLRVLSNNEILSSNSRLLSADVVGRHGIKFVWADGHDDGIYTFDYLRQLCQCELCSAAKKHPHD